MKECPACRHCFPDDFNNCPSDGDALLRTITGDTVLDQRYQLDLRLGQGGMGIVFKGRHLFLKTPHAIKVILPDLVGNDPMLATRFRQEAIVAARIRHRNIVTVTDYGVASGGMPYLVMEFIKGKSLQVLLAEQGRLSPERALEIMAAVCAGVGAAHQQGIVHRDLKPLNIMLQDDLPYSEGVKVLDFGLAKIKSGEFLGSFVAAQTTGLMGSPFYMAPELWSDEEPDKLVDVYSLGVILFQILTDDLPFKGATIPGIMNKHLTQPPPSLATLGVNVPAAVDGVVRHALAKKREDRLQSVEDFLNELREAVLSANAGYVRLPIPAAVDSRSVTMFLPETGSGEIERGSSSRPPGEVSQKTLALPDSQQRIEHEADRLRHEFEEAQLRADEARQRAEEADRRRAAEEAARKLAEEQAALRLAEEAARKLAEEEAARRQAEEEAARKLAEEEAARRHAEEVAARKRAEEQAALRLAEEEARKLAEEETARKRAAEEAARLAREVAEAQRRAEEARLLAEEEARRRIEEEAARWRAEEKERQVAAEVEEKRRTEEARQRAEEEARKRAEQEEQTLALQAAEEQRLAEHTARDRAAEESRALAESKAKSKREEKEYAAGIERDRLAREDPELDRFQHTVPAVSLTETLVLPPDTQTEHQRTGLPASNDGSLSGAEQQTVSLQSQPIGPGQTWQQSQPSVDVSVPDFNVEKKRRFVFLIIGGLGVTLIVIVLAVAVVLYQSRKPSVQGSENPRGRETNPSATPSPNAVKIDGSTFQMGRSDVSLDSSDAYDLSQFPAHSVPVKTFWMDKTEVTNEEYAEFVRATKHSPPPYWKNGGPPPGNLQLPVTEVSLNDAKSFADWRSQRDHEKWRLPTEEEWEYAARNGAQDTFYPWGNQWLDDHANLKASSLKSVGSYPQGASRWGVLDLIGNAWEWTSSKAVPYPDNKLLTIPPGRFVIRGGSYQDPSSGPKAVTATRRWFIYSTDKDQTVSFRLVRDEP